MKKRFIFFAILSVFVIFSGVGCERKSDDLLENYEKLKKMADDIDWEEVKSEHQERELDKFIKEELEKESEKEQVFDIVPYDIRFTFSYDWTEETDGSPYDLRMKREGKYYCCIFGFKDIDLSNGMTPDDIYEFQKEDIFEVRDFVELVKEEPVWEDENKKIYRELYSGEFNKVKNYYYCCMIDFKEPAEGFAWVIFSGVPSWVENDLEELDQILMTAEDTGTFMDESLVSENEV